VANAQSETETQIGATEYPRRSPRHKTNPVRETLKPVIPKNSVDPADNLGLRSGRVALEHSIAARNPAWTFCTFYPVLNAMDDGARAAKDQDDIPSADGFAIGRNNGKNVAGPKSG
jgi:hypothetical protein